MKYIKRTLRHTILSCALSFLYILPHGLHGAEKPAPTYALLALYGLGFRVKDPIKTTSTSIIEEKNQAISIELEEEQEARSHAIAKIFEESLATVIALGIRHYGYTPRQIRSLTTAFNAGLKYTLVRSGISIR